MKFKFHYLISILFFIPVSQFAQVQPIQVKGFVFQIEQDLPGAPEIIYDAITGDISGWWDHTFSQKPVKFYIEPKPGGGFYEIFDDTGDGVLHAKVTAAQRGKLLRMDGPLGLAGKAFHMVTTYTFESSAADSTTLKVDVHMSGEIDLQTAQVVEKVWHHFIVEQFTPYIRAGKHLN